MVLIQPQGLPDWPILSTLIFLPFLLLAALMCLCCKKEKRLNEDEPNRKPAAELSSYQHNGSAPNINTDFESRTAQNRQLPPPPPQQESPEPYAAAPDLSTEHPYARVIKDEDEVPESSESPPPAVPEKEEPSIPHSRSRATLSGEDESSHRRLDEFLSISAAYAISGSIPANQELPYMTPPLLRSDETPPPPAAVPPAAEQQQGNFSGDSQDSGKGYTRLSVREPLEVIMSQIPHHESLYVRVSDDSDDMYDNIDSETYEIIGQNKPRPSQLGEAGAYAIPGMKPEKRELNSPLPPAPAEFSDPPLEPADLSHMYSQVDKSRKTPKTSKLTVQLQQPSAKPVEEMYAKVHKNKEATAIARRSLDLDKPAPVGSLAVRGSVSPQILRNHVQKQDVETGAIPKVKPGPARSKAEINYSEFETVRDWKAEFVAAPAVPVKSPHQETYREPPYSKPEPPYAKVEGYDGDESETGYAKVRYQDEEPVYESGYEVLKKMLDRNDSEGEPGYEQIGRLRHPGYEEIARRRNPGYEEIARRRNPGYEEIARRHQDPGYERVHLDSETSEAGYETLPVDPNYETVKFLNHDPCYERLNHHNERGENTSSLYESVSLYNTSETGAYPPYERLRLEREDSDSDCPGYERLRKVTERRSVAAAAAPVQLEAPPTYATVDKNRKRKSLTTPPGEWGPDIVRDGPHFV